MYFCFNHPAPSEIYTLSLHDALPICDAQALHALRDGKADADRHPDVHDDEVRMFAQGKLESAVAIGRTQKDRKSTRLNSSHEWISYAVFCLKKKKKTHTCSNNMTQPE